jgi:hypothetical protein
VLEELAAAVRGRRVSAEELVRMSLDRIERLNPLLNAVISVREQAVDEARELDQPLPHIPDWKLTARRLAAIHFDGLAGAAATATEQ